jgi:mono/diheme cytochrome c family protein
MKQIRIGRWSAAAALVAAAAIASQATGGTAPAAGDAKEREAAVARGDYLVRIGGCNDCHTPMKMGPKGPEPDMTRMLSGHPEKLELPPPPAFTEAWTFAGNSTNTAAAGPWGISFARNLTPDPETGLGSWTEEQFIRTIRTGRHLGIPSGRPILPPMPWQAYAQMTDEDLNALWAYLQTVPAIRNEAPQSVPNLPGAPPAN